jgi:hypothetical protein
MGASSAQIFWPELKMSRGPTAQVQLTCGPVRVIDVRLVWLSMYALKRKLNLEVFLS